MGLTYTDVKKQSEAVFNTRGESWKANAAQNALLPHRDTSELKDIGVGKVLVCAATGPSLEKHIDTLKKYRHKFDLLCCDKSFGILADHGIIADYVNVSDATIPMKWLEPYLDKTENVKLLSNPYANPEWVKAWKGPRYFYINVDVLGTEEVFKKIMGNKRCIAAGSNVSNAMFVFMTGCDNDNVYANFSGYEKYLLVGYDYAWEPDGNYYAFNNPVPKRNYMHHLTMMDLRGAPVFSSENLLFSARWLVDYTSAFKHLNVLNCSGQGLLDIRKGDLEQQLKSYDPTRQIAVRASFDECKKAQADFDAARKKYLKESKSLWQ